VEKNPFRMIEMYMSSPQRVRLNLKLYLPLISRVFSVSWKWYELKKTIQNDSIMLSYVIGFLKWWICLCLFLSLKRSSNGHFNRVCLWYLHCKKQCVHWTDTLFMKRLDALLPRFRWCFICTLVSYQLCIKNFLLWLYFRFWTISNI
jgi:hypothetical protein